MRWTAVVNPAAGRGRAARLIPRLGDALAAAGVEASVGVSRDVADLRRLTTAAFERGDAVLAAGGDGTIAVVAGIAAEAGGLLAVVPAGSGNDFARVLGLATGRPLDALGVLRAGREAKVDLARANGQWFCSVASTGFDAEANRWANTVRLLSGTALYVAATLRTLATYRPRRFRLIVNDGPAEDHTAWFVAVGNGAAYAGGMRITPHARLDDGLLDVTVIGPLSRPDFLWSFPKVFRGTHVAHPLVETRRGRCIRIESREPDRGAEMYASGERVGSLPATVEVAPDALRVLVPREWDPDGS